MVKRNRFAVIVVLVGCSAVIIMLSASLWLDAKTGDAKLAAVESMPIKSTPNFHDDLLPPIPADAVFNADGSLYLDVFNRSAPLGLAEWVAYAQSHSCSIKVADYLQVFRDTARWRSVGGVAASHVAREKGLMKLAEGRYTAGRGFQSPSRWPGPSGLLEPLDSVFIAAGIKSFVFLVNSKDEPLSLPLPSNGSTPTYNSGNASDVSPYLNQLDALARSPCFSRELSSAANAHGYFLGPGSFVTQPRAIPVFSQSKTRCFWDFVVPLAGQATVLRETHGHVNDVVAWEDKKPVLFWRGSTTSGSHSNTTNWRDFHRTRLVRWAQDLGRANPKRVFDAGIAIPDFSKSRPPPADQFFIDVGFGAVIQCQSSVCDEIKAEYPPKTLVSFEKTCEFKYLIVVDGNTWPNRLQRYLETNSVILYNGIFIDWYIWQLEPMVHYVPVAYDFSDLEEKMEWLMNNDDLARKISENARAFIRQKNELTQMQCYSGLMMLEYADLYKPDL
ncbi:hypothetical protein HK100_001416 [Physocladia obscura]|uniref:Glycosyl transferase CAP10 domain-containing protein n=1 Tax=Physocladia obscura TaxID=109957 RepID=A0AAD5SWU4_9FUNG|nr:hypothetical protein HK100_001416 [Physocladia obscura]